jgi:IS5 family transposase
VKGKYGLATTQDCDEAGGDFAERSSVAGGVSAPFNSSLPGSRYDGHTLAKLILAMEALIGNTIARVIADAGYRGHDAPPD